MSGPAEAPRAPNGAAPAPAAVSMRGITKRFPGVVANDRVDFVVPEFTGHQMIEISY